jgi:tRNA(Ile)-lysidine synthase
MEDASACAVTERELPALFASVGRYDCIALAVSGGPDSLALLYLFARWRQLTLPNLPTLILTVDHTLRASSADEAVQVAHAAHELGLPHETLIWQGAKPATGIARAARDARYRLLCERLAREKFSRRALLTAHTQDDQAETVLMRLARGSGVGGLSGMKPERQMQGFDITLMRPLLTVPKQRLEATLAALGKSWVTDPTNTDLSYERPRLRASARLRHEAGLTDAALSLSASRLARADAALSMATDALARACARSVPGLSITIDRSILTAAPLELQVRLVNRAVCYSGGTHKPPRLSEIERLVEWLSNNVAACTLGGCRIAKTAATIVVTREVGRTGLPMCTLAPGISAIWDNRFIVALAPSSPVICTVRGLTAAEWAKLRVLDDKNTIPALIALTMPSFWVGSTCVALPCLRRVSDKRHTPCSKIDLWDDTYGSFCTIAPRDGHDLTSTCHQTS